MKYRSRTEIVPHILEAAVGGTARTKLMYKTFLSYEQLKEYLAILVKNGLIDYDERTLEYKTTEKGARVVKLYQQLDEMMMQKTTKHKIWR